MAKHILSSTTGLTGFQAVHDQSGGNTHIDIATGQIRVSGKERMEFSVAEWIVSGVLRDRHNLRRKGMPGMMAEMLALLGTGEEPDQLPMKRIPIDKSVRPLVEMLVKQVPRAELLAAFNKIQIPFNQFWLEMPYLDGETLRIRMAYWFQKKDNHIHVSTYESSIADKSTDGMQGFMLKENEWIEIHPDRIDIQGYQFDEYATMTEESAFRGIDLLDKRAGELLATLVALGSKRIGNIDLFREPTVEENAARAKEFRVNKMRIREGKSPKLPLHPIFIEIGARLQRAIDTGKIKEVKQLLGITSVRAHTMHLRDGREVPRREHDRHFPSDVEIDRRGVVRNVVVNPELQQALDRLTRPILREPERKIRIPGLGDN